MKALGFFCTPLICLTFLSCGEHDEKTAQAEAFGETVKKAPQDKVPRALNSLDSNADGMLTKDESGTGIWSLLSPGDKNGDGKISRDELRDIPRPEPGVVRHSPDQILAAFDADGDGKLGFDEMPEWMEDDLADADADEDGAISSDEFEAKRVIDVALGDAGPPPPSNLIEILDRDGDGQLNLSEMPEEIRENAETIDTDEDGQISDREIEAFRKFEIDTGLRAPPRPSELIRSLDHDGDGKLALSDLPPDLSVRLSEADADNDGNVSVDELEAHRDLDFSLPSRPQPEEKEN